MCRCSPLPMQVLFSESELADDRTVTLDVYLLQIVEQASSLTDHLLKTAAAVEVLFVGFQVRGQVVDTGSQNGDLNFGRACVSFMGSVLFDEAELFFFLHWFIHLSFIFGVSHSNRWVNSRL